jgi:hypothetical protein
MYMRVLLAVAIIVVAIPGTALAQPPGPPPIELGVQIGKKIDDPISAPRRWTGRVTLNLTPLTALEGTADILPRFTNVAEGGPTTSSKGYSGHWRQTLFASGRWQVFGVLGAGTNRVEQDVPEQIFQGRDGPQVIPARTFIDTEFVAHLGPGVQVEVLPWLALRGDIRLTVGDNNGGVRGMIGGAIPLGRFRAGSRPTGPTPPLAAWQRVKPGREVWVTTDSGSLLHGEVAAVSNSTLTLRQKDGEVPIGLNEIRLVEGRDGLKNGFLIGGAAGAVSGGLLFGWAASTFCESESCNGVEGVAVLLGAASGLAVGGLLGAMVDGAIPGRQPLFERTAIRVSPVLSRETKGVDLTFSWR